MAGRMVTCDKDSELIKLLTVFPAEIWDTIFEELEDLEDIAICAEAFPAFDDLLRPRIITWQFAQVLRILDTHKYLDFKDTKTILKCRLVCSSWKRAVNHILQTLPYNFKIRKYKNLCFNPRDMTPDVPYRTCLNLYNFSADKLEGEVLPKMDSAYYQKNCPSPSRHLNILAYKGSEKHTEITKLFLDKVGKQFWHLSYSSFTSSRDWFKNLMEFARRMPNLKSLCVSTNPTNMRNQRDFVHLQRSLNHLDSKFPTLTNLEMVTASKMPYQALLMILDTNQNVKYLDVYRNPNDNFPMSCLQNQQDLLVLNIEIFSWPDYFALSSTWKLKSLKLDLDTVWTMVWSSFFSKLQIYKDTLEELTLAFPREFDTEGRWSLFRCLSKPLRLPGLKRLDIKLKNLCCYNFLKGLKSLEFLLLRHDHDEDKRLSQFDVIKTELRSTNYRKISLWDVVPTLRQVDYRPCNMSPIWHLHYLDDESLVPMKRASSRSKIYE